MTLRHSFMVGLLIIGSAAAAEETKTTYSVGSAQAEVTTVVKKVSADKEKLMRGFLFEKVAEAVRQFPMVTSIEFDKDTKEELSTSTYTDYWEHKRNFPAMVHLNLPTSVTMMVKVEEVFRSCKSASEKQSSSSSSSSSSYTPGGSYSSSSDGECTLNSSVRIKGPYAIYGNFASSLNLERLLKEKQQIVYNVSRDWSEKTSMKVEGRFSIESELFDTSLLKFLDAFNLKVSDQASPVMTRNNILLGIARVLRMNNERVVE